MTPQRQSQFTPKMKLVILLHLFYWSIHTKDESKRGTAFAFIFGVNWLWRCGVTASFGVFFHERKCNGMKMSNSVFCKNSFSNTSRKCILPNTWIPWNLSFCYILVHEKRLQTMLWQHNPRVNSHQRWKQMRFSVCFHLWCEFTLVIRCHSIAWSLFSWNKM